MKRNFLGSTLAVAAALLTFAASAQTTPVRVGQLIATGGSLVAGDVIFSNFTQVPATVGIAPPLDGTGNLAASAVVNADGSVSLAFSVIDPATGAPALITGAYMQSLAYDVSVTNPALLLGSVNQRFGPGTGGGFNVLTYRAPAPSVVQIPQFFPGTDGTLIFDNARGSTTLADGSQALANQRGGVLFPMPCVGGIVNGVFVPATMNQMDCASPLPGGNRASVGLENFFGVVTDNHSFVLSNFDANGRFSFDGISLTFTLVPADTPVIPIPVTLQGFDVSRPGIGSLSLAHTVDADGLTHPGFAPAGGVAVSLTTSNAAALPLPATLTMPQGSSVTTFTVADATVDAPTPVTATATYNGVTLQQTPTVSPTVPLTLVAFGNVSTLPQSNIKLGAVLNRVNFSPTVIAVTSSNPAVVPAPASLTIPALTIPQELTPGLPVVVTIPVKAVAVDTPVTFTGTFNGVTLTSSVTIPKTVDSVIVSKAELVVKNLALRVEATSTVPAAVLTLFNATTGRLIGTMTNTGLSGSGAKYSFQGTVSPVTSVLLTSSFSGTATSPVAQK
jgi:hypothetical protein